KPDTILGWYRQLIANKFDGSRFRRSAGRPRVDEETEGLVVQMAKENPTWGYDRIVGALANLGQRLSDQTVARRCGRCAVLLRRIAPQMSSSVCKARDKRGHIDDDRPTGTGGYEQPSVTRQRYDESAGLSRRRLNSKSVILAR